MIFLVVFGLIAIVVISLNIKDSANLQKIENHLKAQNCKNIIYSKGVYKAICNNKVVQISNGFSVDLKEDKTVFRLKQVKSMDEKALTIILNESYEIDFKKEENKKEFLKSLKEKVNK